MFPLVRHDRTAARSPWVGRQVTGYDEINLAFRKEEFDKAVLFDVVRCKRFGYRVESGRQITQVLRIGKKDVDVLTETMTMSAHQDCPATETPPLNIYPGQCR